MTQQLQDPAAGSRLFHTGNLPVRPVYNQAADESHPEAVSGQKGPVTDHVDQPWNPFGVPVDLFQCVRGNIDLVFSPCHVQAVPHVGIRLFPGQRA